MCVILYSNFVFKMRQANYKKKLHTHLKTVDESWQLRSPFFKMALKLVKNQMQFTAGLHFATGLSMLDVVKP